MRALASAAVAVLLGFNSAWGLTGDPAVDALIDRLVEKGVMTRDDAREVDKKFKKPVDAANGNLPQPAQSTPAVAEKLPSGGAKLPLSLKVRAQTRLDVGDLLVDPEGRYETESDLFLRRVRLEVEKEFTNPPVGKELDLNLTLEADRFEQDFRNGVRRTPGNRVGLQYLYADWIFVDPFGVEIGKHKLPFLRVELTSSSRQLLIERPAVTGTAKDLFGDYHQTQIMAHGGVAHEAFRYYVSYADGVSNLDGLQDVDGDATAVRRQGLGKAYMARMEIAPFGFAPGAKLVEKKKDDTGIGAENHLTFGVDGGFQQDVRYATDAVADAELDSSLISLDLSGRYTLGDGGTLTGQMEYVRFKRDFNYKPDEKPQGGYVQAGYLLPWILLRGRFEPAFRYEVFDHDRVENEGESGSKERNFSIGTNHYLQKHGLKWSYNFVHTRFDRGIAEAAASRNRNTHQLQLQLYF